MHYLIEQAALAFMSPGQAIARRAKTEYVSSGKETKP